MAGDLYMIFNVNMSPSDVGFNVIKRPRLYTILLSKAKLRLKCQPDLLLKHIISHMKSVLPRETAGKACLAVSSRDVVAYENSMRMKRGQTSMLATPSADWRYLLTPSQRQFPSCSADVNISNPTKSLQLCYVFLRFFKLPNNL